VRNCPKLAKRPIKNVWRNIILTFSKKVASSAMVVLRSRDKFIASIIDQQTKVLGKKCNAEDAYAFLTELS